MANSHHYATLLMENASGATSPAVNLLVRTHLAIAGQKAMRLSQAWDAVGGALLEGIAPEEMGAAPLVVSKDRAAPKGGDATGDQLCASAALIEKAMRDPAEIDWRWRAPAMRQCALPIQEASLIRLAGGKSVARHTHTGEELTLVLRGGFEDEAGVYEPGDIAFADESTVHRPHVAKGSDCICLVAMTGEWRFKTLMGRIAARFLS
jgi:putative transcriptional regulator